MAKKKKIKVLVMEVNKEPEVREIPNTPQAMIEIIGGSIASVPIFRGVNIDLICDDEGKLKGYPPNRVVQTDRFFGLIVGTFLIARYDDKSGEFVSLSDDDIKTYTEKFALKEQVWIC